jgi:hypothetical protein
MTQTTSESSTPPCSDRLINKIKTETPKGLPAKPKDANGFADPVAWLGGRELVASLKLIILYSLFGGKLDSRDWMTGMFNPIQDKAAQASDTTEAEANEAIYSQVVETGRATGEPGADEFWFDYVADSGDGQMPTYNIAYLCMRHLQLPTKEGKRMLPRGKFLFIGGDTAYHVANYETLAKRFQAPFWWAYKELVCEGEIPEAEMSTRRPIFAIPGNHDYYDVLDGFNRQFRRPSTGDDGQSTREPLLQLPTFERHQEASYAALQLPFDWWLWGLDIERNDIDFRQKIFFRKLNEKFKPKKLIIATPSPTTVFGKYLGKHKPLGKVFRAIRLKRLFLKDEEKVRRDRLAPGECRLDLSGDVHHYARYWGPRTDGDATENPRVGQDEERPWDNSYASVVSGGGGAFFDPTNTYLGDIKEQALYPTVRKSLHAMSTKILDVSVISSGGFVHILGALLAFVICFAAIVAPNTRETLFANPTVLVPSNANIVVGLVSELISLALLLAGNLVLAKVSGFATLLKKFDKWIRVKASESNRQERPWKRFAAKQALVIWVFFLVTVLCMALGGLNLRSERPFLPFSDSLLVFIATVWAGLMTTLYVQYTQRLNEQANRRPLYKLLDYSPTWWMLISAVAIFCFALWFFGQSSSSVVLFADLVFMTVITIFPLALILGLAFWIGGERHGGKGKFGYFVMGSWHTLLHLTVPVPWTLSVFYYFQSQGISTVRSALAWKTFVLILSVALIVLFLYWVFRSIAIRYVRDNHRKRLVATWIVYGVVMIALPALFRERFVGSIFTSPESTAKPSLPWLLALCVAAAGIGAFMSCVWFGWYLAVALLFNGHNNEAGGAARLEGYKQFMRIRLTKDDLTAYVIGFDKAQPEAKDLIGNLKLIDQFTLTVK